MSTLIDAAARDAIRRRLDATLVVEAAAGTGKTTALVHRIVAVLAGGHASVDGLVAVTFTEKAAGELKLRLRAEIECARQAAARQSPERTNLEEALARLEEARVSTIHTFCADLLRERPIEARVDPQFQVLNEGDAARLFTAAFHRWLQTHLQNPAEGLARALRRRARQGDDAPAARLLGAARLLAEWRDFPTAWRRDAFDRRAAIDTLAAHLAEFAALSARCADGRDPLCQDTAAARRAAEAVQRAEAVCGRDYDELEGILVGLAGERELRRPRSGRGRFYFKEIERKSVQAALAEFVAALEAFKRAADADLAALLHAELRGALDTYEEAKRRAGALDFVDLLVRARDLIREVDAVRMDFQRRFTHLFVDEFQDTDPLQAEILLLLAADDPAERDWRAMRPAPGKLFVVGDPKQSIYRFRRADVGTYLEVQARFAARGADVLHLTTSFRAVPALQAFVNAAFAPRLHADADALQAGYVPLAPYRADADAQPAVVALPVPRPYGWRGVTQTAIKASLPDAVGAFVDWLLRDSGWTVGDRDGHGRIPIRPHHVCILFRRFESFWDGDVTREYVRALEARSVPHLLVGGRSFHGREEVETMRAALTAIEWPEDELALYATLRGSLFAIGDEALFVYRAAHGRLHPFRLPPALADELAPIGEALGLLAELHRGRNRRPVADTIARLLDATRAHAGFALRPAGEQALANVLHIAELARSYEAGGGISFRGFVDRLLDEAERAQASEAPILEEGSEGVRIMTVHKAKGLEFPVVVLADITAGLTGGVGRFVDPARRLCALRIGGWAPVELGEHEAEEARRDEAEGLRVAYVAATRARDLLVVPAVGDEPYRGGWVSCLNDTLYPERGAWRNATAAPGCPQFGADTVIDRPAELAGTVEGIRPGRHAFEGYDVVWWDPAQLRLGAEPRFGLRQEELLGKGADRKVVEAQLRRFETWQRDRAAALAAGAQPTHRVQTATARAAERHGPPGTVELVALPRAAGRPAGARFGALVHAALATVPLAGSREDIVRVTEVQARLLGALPEEVAAAVEAVAAALAHPLLRAAAHSAECRRETPVTVREDDGVLVEGVVDLAYLDGDIWVVVDFKTDQEVAGRADVYRRQVALYVTAIGSATGHKARGILLRV
jgi:ATP-dependent exoDNAse (exonuclease V) beta subunit